MKFMPNDPFDLGSRFSADLRNLYHEDLQSVLLVGSAARGDFIPGKSDINTLVVLSPEGMEWLEKSYDILQKFARKKLAIPHFMTQTSIMHSLDSFPLEFLDFKTFHKVILGGDPLAEIQIPKDAIRLQVEREARGKLFLLRQGFAGHAGNEKELRHMLTRAVGAFTAIFQGILALQDHPIPMERRMLFDKASDLAVFSPAPFHQILEIKQGKKGKNARVIFKETLHAIEAIVQWVDQYTV
jgi:predicted nucleotidyltransferase